MKKSRVSGWSRCDFSFPPPRFSWYSNMTRMVPLPCVWHLLNFFVHGSLKSYSHFHAGTMVCGILLAKSIVIRKLGFNTNYM